MSKIKILIPIYNDWQSAFKLLEDIDFQVRDLKHEFSIIIVNDCSTEEKPTNDFNFNNLKSIKIINMKTNKGHARCNASGLRYIAEHEDYDYIIPMDGDGEDRPEEITLLINKINNYPDKVITANRVKRSEGSFFKLLNSHFYYIRESVWTAYSCAAAILPVETISCFQSAPPKHTPLTPSSK